jgi:hypothetical protein
MPGAASMSAAPPASWTTLGSEETVVAGLVSWPPRSAGTTSAAATNGSGASPRNTQRQPATRAIALATPGPIKPGITHALDNSASMRGCRSTG